MSFWDIYPKSGRTNWIGGHRAQLPCGVGWAYEIWTTGATGIYAKYNQVRRVLHTVDAFPEDIRWNEDPTPAPGEPWAQLSMKHPLPSFDIEWNIFVDTGAEVDDLSSTTEMTNQNLRFTITLPRPKNPLGAFLPEFPNLWHLQPLTREQWIELEG